MFKSRLHRLFINLHFPTIRTPHAEERLNYTCLKAQVNMVSLGLQELVFNHLYEYLAFKPVDFQIFAFTFIIIPVLRYCN